jgi:hypothetical protein
MVMGLFAGGEGGGERRPCTHPLSHCDHMVSVANLCKTSIEAKYDAHELHVDLLGDETIDKILVIVFCKVDLN